MLQNPSRRVCSEGSISHIRHATRIWLWLLEFRHDIKSWSSRLFNTTLHTCPSTGNGYVHAVLLLEHAAGDAPHSKLVVCSGLFEDIPDTRNSPLCDGTVMYCNL